MKNIFFSKLFLMTLALQVLYTSACYFIVATNSVEGAWVGGFLLLAGSLLSATLNRLPTYLYYRKALNQLNLYSDAVAASTSHLFDATQLVSSASTEQAASIQQTVATITELNTTINKSVENAQRSFEVAEGSKAIATEGHKAVTDMIGAMDEINGSNNKIVAEIEAGNERIINIVKVITEISNKTKIINDIVFQTKLLSFNASVEAARAGEHGKGFAVVAEEIGNLAQMSGTASREISEMLHLSIKKVNGIVEDTSVKVQGLMQEGKASVSSGILVAKRCGDILQQVVGSVGQVNQMISEISQASKEQALGMNEIAHAMTQLDTATQQNANTAQNLADYSANISWQTERFRDSLNVLRADRLGGASPKTTRVATQDPVKTQGFSPAPAGTLNFRRRAAEPSNRKVIKRAVGGDVPLGDSPDFEDV